MNGRFKKKMRVPLSAAELRLQFRDVEAQAHHWHEDGVDEVPDHAGLHGSKAPIAYHEAGHAVGAYFVGIGKGRRGITIVLDGDNLGCCYTRLGFTGNSGALQ